MVMVLVWECEGDGVLRSGGIAGEGVTEETGRMVDIVFGGLVVWCLVGLLKVLVGLDGEKEDEKKGKKGYVD